MVDLRQGIDRMRELADDVRQLNTQIHGRDDARRWLCSSCGRRRRYSELDARQRCPCGGIVRLER